MAAKLADLPVMEELVNRVIVPTDCSLDERGMCDLELLLSGAMAPLTSYLTLEDYKGCLDTMRLSNGNVWTIPVVLPVPVREFTVQTEPNPPKRNRPETPIIKLRDHTHALVANLTVQSVFVPDLAYEKEKMFGQEADRHPFAKYMDANYTDCVYVGGQLSAIHPIIHYDFRQYRMTPSAAKLRLAERQWSTVVGFQTRNPMHRSHFELTRQALAEVSDLTGEVAHLMITPAVGPTQPGDVDYRVRVRCYERIMGHYEEEPFLVLLPIAMRMAGPREAVWHAMIRRNYGCTHFIVGRDHAGPSVRRSDGSTFFGPYDAHKLLEKFAKEIGISPVFGKNMVYCGPELGYLQEGQVPDGVQTQSISGTRFREMLVKREPVPAWFCFSNVVAELHSAYVPHHQRGLCVYFTGLPCAGKSTLACALEAVLLESRHEPRRVTVLDADIIRTHLSKGLGFSKADRSLNVRRIGYVASEIVKHGGICLVANIAPYKEDREYNRRLIESVDGNYVEVFVSTPLEVCEQRDIKELYKKARSGIIKQFTGISDPYEVPEQPSLTVNSTEDAVGKVKLVHSYLKKQGYCL